MEKYNNEAYLMKEIIEQSRHQFIYGYEGDTRDNFAKKIVATYPINMDCNNPMAVYLNDFELPNIKSNLDKYKINIITNEYLSFTIALNIISKSKENIIAANLNERLTRLLHLINSSKRDAHPQIKNIDDLLIICKEAKEFYHQSYLNNENNLTIDKLALPFLEISMFITNFKKALNNNSYFALIIDNKKDIPLSLVQSINLLLASRINKDLSVKIITAPNKWASYTTQNGTFVEAVHDYGEVELDNSYSEYMQRIRKKYNYF